MSKEIRGMLKELLHAMMGGIVRFFSNLLVIFFLEQVIFPVERGISRLYLFDLSLERLSAQVADVVKAE